MKKFRKYLILKLSISLIWENMLKFGEFQISIHLWGLLKTCHGGYTLTCSSIHLFLLHILQCSTSTVHQIRRNVFTFIKKYSFWPFSYARGINGTVHYIPMYCSFFLILLRSSNKHIPYLLTFVIKMLFAVLILIQIFEDILRFEPFRACNPCSKGKNIRFIQIIL